MFCLWCGLARVVQTHHTSTSFRFFAVKKERVSKGSAMPRKDRNPSSEALGGDNNARLPFSGAHPSGFRYFSRCPCAHFDTGLRSRKNRNDGSLVLGRSLDQDFETGLTRAVLPHPGDGQGAGGLSSTRTRTSTKRHDPGLRLRVAIPSPSTLLAFYSAFHIPNSAFPRNTV